MHLVFVAPNSAIRGHKEPRLSNSSLQVKDQNLTVKLQIVEVEKQNSTTPPFFRTVLEDQLLIPVTGRNEEFMRQWVFNR